MSYRDMINSESSLLGYWRLGDFTGSTVAVDNLGITNGTYHGAVGLGAQSISACPYNQAAMFNGVDQYVDLGNSNRFNIGSGFTLEAWVMWNSFASDAGGHALISKSNSSADGFAVYQGVTAPYNQLQAVVVTSTGAKILRSNTLLSTGTFYHVVVTWDGSTLRLYLNGVLDTSIPAAGSYVISASNLFLASTYIAGGPKFNGILDEVSVYGSVLPVSTISHHYSVGATPPTAMASDMLISKFGDTAVLKLTRSTRKVQKKSTRFGKTQQLRGGNKVRDITSIKRTVTITWDMLPHMDADTVDDSIGYLTLYALYAYGLGPGENGGPLTLQMPDGLGGFTTMKCYLGSSTKAKMWRHAVTSSPRNAMFWSVTIELVEE